MHISDFDYTYPDELVALHPLATRDQCRLLVVNRQTGHLTHTRFDALGDFFDAGDLLVLNNSRVIPARLFATQHTGGRIECLLVRALSLTLSHKWERVQKSPLPQMERNLKQTSPLPLAGEGQGEGALWQCLLTHSGRVKKNEILAFDAGLKARVLNDPAEYRLIRFEFDGNFEDHLKRLGHMPLPPYIKRGDEAADFEDYQTVFGKMDGSVAAPTAGLHFTQSLFDKLDQRGIQKTEVTLHVGPGTFLPVRSGNLEEHVMHAEWCTIDSQTAQKINDTIQAGKKIVAVGTTATRTLESFADGQGRVAGGSKDTHCFIKTKDDIRITNALITNFHQPKSTLLVLVCAFAGHGLMMKAYGEAIQKKYRLFSYGDAMLIV